MIDLHSHILPGIDDGVQTEDESVEFARLAVADGVQAIVATPHCKDDVWENRRDDILQHVKRLRARLERERIPLELHPGAEVHICPELPARVEDGRAPTLADNGKTLLLELSLTQYPFEMQNLLFQLKLAGIEVLFAHPERIRYFQEDPSRFAELVRMGAWGQITTGSITGQFGREAQEYSDRLLREGLVHVIASDAHNTRGRPPVLSEAVRAASAVVGEARAACMVLDAPRALLEGKGPDLPPVDGPRRARVSLFKRWFRK
jgi:protein-tyrosine phosphatase